jgi:hypothetical protein
MAAPEDALPTLHDGFKQPLITDLDLGVAGIT